MPYPTIYQPIVDQEFCQDNVCEKKSLCREFKYNGEDYELHETHELKKCHGNFSVTVKDFNKVKQFIEETESWMILNCKLED